ncbi:ankyrin repeat domain-containing protein [Chitinibacter sp. GC72]|uniref:ankyrin repeat domain-containing protein n=1 Tax=Chitinibacter sp. GC72 TaxID=1526917 RepID=UPI0012FB6A31|nr:ankyrin repeat domain-containing protein [Chitinibacter sp. GC72]
MTPAVVALLGNDGDFYPHHLEQQYPRILEQVVALWGSEQLEPFISELAVDERGTRQGFPPAVASELFTLYQLHTQRFGGEPEQEQTWDHVKLQDDGLSFYEVNGTQKDYFQAAESGNTLRVLVHLKAGIDIETGDEYGKTALIWAATQSHLALVGLLLSRNANTETRDLGGFTALHWAAAAGNLSSLALLLEHGAAVNAQSKAGITPLMQAASRGHHAAIRSLLEAGADLGLLDGHGQSALSHALQTNHYRSSETLLLQFTKLDTASKSKHQATLAQGLSHTNPAIRQLFIKHRFELQVG